MNKIFALMGAGCFAVFIFWLLFLKMISPGHVGVVVNYFGDEQGVDPKGLTTGVHWIAPWKTVYEFPTYEQNITWEGQRGFNFQTAEGMAVHCDLGITFHLLPEHIPAIFQRYRRGVDEISDLFIRNYVRAAINTQASKMAIEDLYGAGKEEFFKQVQLHVRKDLNSLGIDITRIYIIGRFGFPDGVIHALNAKIEATQRAQQRENELREAEAQAKKDVAKAEGAARCKIAEAEAEAKSNYMLAESAARSNKLLSQSITRELVEWQTVERWNGVLPQVSGSNTPFINLGRP